MRRREFLGLLCSAAPGGNASAQLSRHAPRIAIVHLSGTNEVVSEVGTSSWRAFFAELRQRGYIEGSTVIIDRYAAETGFWRHVPQGLIDFLARAPDVIVTESSAIARNINAMRPGIPIVALIPDPIGQDVATTLTKPGRNITGITTDTGPALLGKQLELLLEVMPSCRHVACLGSSWPNTAMRTLWRDASTRGVTVQEFLVHAQFREGNAEAHYVAAFPAMLRDQADGILVLADAEHFFHAPTIARLALDYRLALISPFRHLTEFGGLLSYGPDWGDLERRRAEYVARILDGARAEDLPLQQPTKFELVLNLKTAKVLAVSIPSSVLVRADEVLE
jgi:putative tryptophan/tyrosine transport system substrate-binding protein